MAPSAKGHVKSEASALKTKIAAASTKAEAAASPGKMNASASKPKAAASSLKAKDSAAVAKTESLPSPLKAEASADVAVGSPLNATRHRRRCNEESASPPVPEAAKASAPSEAAAKGKAKAKGRPKAKAKAKAEAPAGGAEAPADEADQQPLSLEEELAKEVAAQADAEYAAELELLNKSGGNVDVKQWVQVQCDATGEINKLQLSLKINVDELRKAVSKSAGCKTRDLCIKINGHEWVEAMERPLKSDFDHEKDTVRWWKSDRLKRLLKKRELATINNVDKFERSAVHFLCMLGDMELLEEVVCHKDFKFSLVNKQDVFGDTALHYACIMGFPDIVELLLDKQANPESRNINRRTPTQLASEHGHDVAIRALLRSGASLGPNPGKGEWKYPNAEYLAKLNGRVKVLREVEFKKTEEKAMAEMDAHLALLKEGDAAEAQDPSDHSDNDD